MKEILLSVLFAILGAIQWLSSSAPHPIPVEQASANVSTEATPTKKRSQGEDVVKSRVVTKPKSAVPAIPKMRPPPLVNHATLFATTSSPSDEMALAILLEGAILSLTNNGRVAQGLSPLAPLPVLATLARNHSEDMLTNDYFSHEDKSGCGSSCRANNVGYAWSTIGENIYMTTGYDLTAADMASLIIKGWMESPGHHDNILRPGFTHVGIGVAKNGENVYTTAVYARPR